MIMIQRLLILFAMALSLEAFATAQQSDTIILNNVEFPLNTSPLESHIKSIGWKPPEEASIWSSNWRGYIAKWEIVAGKLQLKDASIELKGKSIKNRKRKSIIDDFFPNKGSVIATWYTGALIVPDGEMTNYVHMGYGSSYESYQVLRIKEGVVIEHLSFSNEQFENYKHRKFQSFKETKKFQEELENLMGGEYNWVEDDALDFMQSYHAEYYLSL
jgi:hypothetical protein